MALDAELLKKIALEGAVLDVVELPATHGTGAAVAKDLEEILSNFDSSEACDHYIVRIKRPEGAVTFIPTPSTDTNVEPVSIDSLVNETMEMSSLLSEQRREVENASENPADEYSPEFLLENATLLEGSGDYPLAKNIYRVLVKRGLQIPAGLAGLARIAEHESSLDEAVRLYQEAIAYSSATEYYQSLAALQIRMGRDEDASTTLLHALGLPKLSTEQRFDFHKSLGNCYTRLGKYAKAELHYLKAYEINPNSDVLQVNVGSLGLQKEDFGSALKHFQRALELNPKNDKAISGMGMVYLAQNKIERAHNQFIASLDLNLSNLGAIYNLVKCAYELKNFEQASRILRAYIASHPSNTNILYSYAGILYHQGRFPEAMTQVSRILETHSNHAGASELRELILKKTGA